MQSGVAVEPTGVLDSRCLNVTGVGPQPLLGKVERIAQNIICALRAGLSGSVVVSSSLFACAIKFRNARRS